MHLIGDLSSPATAIHDASLDYGRESARFPDLARGSGGAGESRARQTTCNRRHRNSSSIAKAAQQSLFTISADRHPSQGPMPCDELCEDEAVTLTPEELFIASMLQISDKLIMEMSTRFKSLENINDKFGFLNGGQINEMTLDDLKLKAGELADTYKEDLNKKELIFEIESFKGLH